MKLSILDQVPVSSNQTSHDALMASVKLAIRGEELGYTRFWIAEHHDLQGLACSAPEVMLAYIGAKTQKIRLGSGAVLLPHYKPFKVAEVFNMLATLFPGRIDIGIGRAPGGSAEVTNALSDNYLQKVWKMPDLVKDLLHFINDDYPAENVYEKISAAPIPAMKPVAWLLGTSKKSAALAAKNGMAYAFGQFMSDSDGKTIIQEYYDDFQKGPHKERPEAIITVTAFCADTSQKAEDLALCSIVWALQKEKGNGKKGIPSIQEAQKYRMTDKEKYIFNKLRQKMLIGNPGEIREKLLALKSEYRVDEVMIVTNTHNPEDRIRSFELIAKEVLH